MCDLSSRGVVGGYFDGPRAYRIIMHKLEKTIRTEQDKDFYRQAERLQRATHLPDGCPAADYHKKALSFIVHINPNLAQPYDSDDTTQYIINLMPKGMRDAGRLVKHELTLEGKLHDHLYVIQKCRALVQEEQKAPPTAPSFVALAAADVGSHDLGDLRRVTGMELQACREPRAPGPDRLPR